MHTRFRLALSLTAALALAGPALADGMIVPTDPARRVRGDWAVKYHHVEMRVRDQVASVSVDQEFVNTGRRTLEVEYLFPIPPQAAIDSMTLMVNGKEFSAKLYEAKEARRIYESIVRRKKDPALLEYAGYGLYKTSAFPLEPGKPARVVITYKDTCPKDRDVVEVWYPLNTEKFSAKPLEDVRVRVDIRSRADLTAVYSPTHEVTIDRKGPRQIVATYQASDELPTTDFQLVYKAADEKVGATFLTHQPETGEDGYFMMLVSPNPRTASTEVAAKDVVVVMDHSGSMNGEKLRQAKQGVQHVLNHLNADDRFEVVAYNDSVRTFFGKLVQADANRVGEALARLDAIDATGGTNIHGALTEALKLRASGPRGRPLYVIFLTDGKPTVGQTDIGKIVEEVTSANAADARLFAFGVGYDVNAKLLNWLAKDNRGRSEFVKPSQPVEGKISSLYNKIKHPVMTDLAIELDGVRLTDMYPRNLEDLFDGDQIVLVGRYDGTDAARRPTGSDGQHQSTLVIKGTYQGNERAFEYPVGFRTTGRDNRFAFVEKLWAVRRVGYLLEQIQLSGESKEIVDELIRLSKAYGIMTPYTSFLADENQSLADASRLRGRFMNEKAGRSLASDVSGEAGQRNSANFQQLARAKRAPVSAAAPGSAADAVASIGSSSREAYEADRAENVAGVRHVGNTALYRRGRQWVASNAAHVDLKKDAEKLVDVERFSDRYFKLVRANTTEQNQVLASQRSDEELIIELRGQVYRIR